MTVHEHARRVLSAGVDGEADPDDMALALAHVERCPDCQRAAGDFARVVEALRALTPAGRPAWLDGLPDRLQPRDGGDPPPELPGLGDRPAREEPAPPPPPARRPNRGARLVARALGAVTVAAALGAAALLVVLGAVWVRGELEPVAGTGQVTTVAGGGTTDARASAGAAARAWLAAVDRGDEEQAWALLSPRSKAIAGSSAGLAGRLPALAAGYRPWIADAEAGRTDGKPPARVVLLTEAGAEVRSVVILPPRDQRGRAMAVPVLTVGGTSLVEPFESAIQLRTSRPGDELVVSIRPRVRWVRVVIDDGGPVSPRLRWSAERREHRATVAADLGRGRHTVVTAAIDDKGRIAARADVVEVGPR
jgi:hypothetical protein